MNEKKFSETISYLSMTFSLSQIILECFKFKLWNFGFIFNNSNIEKIGFFYEEHHTKGKQNLFVVFRFCGSL